MVARNATIAALLSTSLISVAPNVLLVLFPHYASGEGEHSPALSLGQALAAGGLLGDVFLHTLPHAGGSHEVGVWVLLGFSVFMVADMAMRSIGNGGHHHHSHKGEGTKNKSSEDNADGHHSEHKTSTVLLNLAADAMHNFTDGLAIGASFSTSSIHDDATVWSLLQSRGGIATLSVLFHEIPHELGDFAILVKNGFSKEQAILAQFGTAVAAMLGSVLGLHLHSFAGDSLVFFTAGGFVYLAACTILPEILEEPATWKFRLAQVACFATGVAFMYAIGLLEEMGDGEHHGHSHRHHHHDEHSTRHDHHHEHAHKEHHEHYHEL